MSQKIALIGAGAMGGAIGARLVQMGQDLTVYDLDAEKVAALVSLGATAASSAAMAAAQADFVVISLNAAQIVERAVFGPQGYEYYKERITLDVNATYQLTRRLSLAASVNNLLNEPQTLLRYGPETPAYARQFQETEYGIQLSLGLRGTF